VPLHCFYNNDYTHYHIHYEEFFFFFFGVCVLCISNSVDYFRLKYMKGIFFQTFRIVLLPGRYAINIDQKIHGSACNTEHLTYLQCYLVLADNLWISKYTGEFCQHHCFIAILPLYDKSGVQFFTSEFVFHLPKNDTWVTDLLRSRWTFDVSMHLGSWGPNP
jgi:hypothetical protein